MGGCVWGEQVGEPWLKGDMALFFLSTRVQPSSEQSCALGGQECGNGLYQRTRVGCCGCVSPAPRRCVRQVAPVPPLWLLVAVLVYRARGGERCPPSKLAARLDGVDCLPRA